MRIVFICGGLEPGKDGVGDYVRKLGQELVNQGHQVGAIALKDPFTVQTEQSSSPSGKQDFIWLRLPLELEATEKTKIAGSFIRDLNPDVLSLQFVPFSFQIKGLPYQLPKMLKELGSGYKWHIMFHELWLGMDRQSTFKERLWGKVQWILINFLLQTLKPGLIHTHCSVYRDQLEKMKLRVSQLPLFSNIPVYDPEAVREKMNRGFKEQVDLNIVLFGGIHSGAPFHAFAMDAVDYAKQHHKKLQLLIVGRNGSEQQNLIRTWEQAGLPFSVLGEMDDISLSRLLAGSYFGLFTTPVLLAEKSGAVAAMREHGLHLICVARDWWPAGNVEKKNPLNLTVYERGKLAIFFQTKPDFTGSTSVGPVARQFINDLNRKDPWLV